MGGGGVLLSALWGVGGFLGSYVGPWGGLSGISEVPMWVLGGL